MARIDWTEDDIDGDLVLRLLTGVAKMKPPAARKVMQAATGETVETNGRKAAVTRFRKNGEWRYTLRMWD